MKIDLSKYPPGTKFKLKNGETVILVGKSQISDDYLIEHIRDEYNIPNCPAVTYRQQNGKAATKTREYDIESVIESVIQPDKYLVSYLTEQDEVNTIVLPINNPKTLNEAVLLPIVSLKTTSLVDIPGRSKRAVKILSWSKIEE